MLWIRAPFVFISKIEMKMEEKRMKMIIKEITSGYDQMSMEIENITSTLKGILLK